VQRSRNSNSLILKSLGWGVVGYIFNETVLRHILPEKFLGIPLKVHAVTSDTDVTKMYGAQYGDPENKIKNPADENAEKVDNSAVGGIDLTAEQMNLQLQNAGKQIKFNVDPAMLAQLRNVPGFTPVVMGMQVMTEASFRQFLGI